MNTEAVLKLCKIVDSGALSDAAAVVVKASLATGAPRAGSAGDARAKAAEAVAGAAAIALCGTPHDIAWRERDITAAFRRALQVKPKGRDSKAWVSEAVTRALFALAVNGEQLDRVTSFVRHHGRKPSWTEFGPLLPGLIGVSL